MENPIKSGWFGGTIIFGNTNALMTPGMGEGVSVHTKPFVDQIKLLSRFPTSVKWGLRRSYGFGFWLEDPEKKNKSLHLQNGHNIKQFYNWGYSYSIYIIRFKTALSTCKLMFGHL